MSTTITSRKTVKFKIGPNGNISAQGDQVTPGFHGDAYTVAVTGVPKTLRHIDIIRPFDKTIIPSGVFEIDYAQLGKNLYQKANWPKPAEAPESVRAGWDSVNQPTA